MISLAVGIALVVAAFLLWFSGTVDRDESMRGDHVVIFLFLTAALVAMAATVVGYPKEVPNVYINMPCAEKPLTTPHQ